MSHERKKYFGGWPLTIAIAILLIIAVILTGILVGPSDGTKEEDTMQLGVLLPLTGDQGTIGEEYLKGIQMAVSECQKNGLAINLIVKDTQSDTGTAIDEFLNLVQEGVGTIIGPASANDAEKIALYAELYGINLLTFANSDKLDKYENHIFKFDPSISSVASAIEILVDKIEDEKDKRTGGTVCILYSKDTYGYAMEELLTKAFEEDNKNTLKIESILIPENLETGMDELITRMAELSPDYVCVLTTNPESYIAIDNAANEKLSSLVCWIGTDYILEKTVAEKLKNNNRTFVLSTTRTMNNDFRNNYTAMFGTEPQDYSIAVISYDAVSMLGKVIEIYGTNPDHISEGLKKIRYIGLTGINKFDEKGNQCLGFSPYALINGEWIQTAWNELRYLSEFWGEISLYLDN